MEIEYGAEVIDKNGKLVGSVRYVMRNTWTGEISKFGIHRKAPRRDLFFSTEDVLEVSNTRVKLKLSFDELGENA